MHSPPITGKTRAIVAPNATDAYVQKQQPKPCIVILRKELAEAQQTTPARRRVRPGHREGLQH
ncbi:hypothetical protein [Achromobacter sp. UBA2119]|uniref:hypothetical protein n=1 Tax=Achromobacter sp. UBA2119 TaxID=1945911 RepID=UPI002580E41E|nr:hypothetical protein [Achromobacter sp. UBA2119]